MTFGTTKRACYRLEVRRGMAWHYKAYELEQRAEDRTTCSTAELEARAARIGLWTDPVPLTPLGVQTTAP